ncbi:MAG: hypothetical protein QOJ62_2203, partial [Actinomycetota bacterium]|nr:hypothetical protein [Actinomycetota bacterium]
ATQPDAEPDTVSEQEPDAQSHAVADIDEDRRRPGGFEH